MVGGGEEDGELRSKEDTPGRTTLLFLLLLLLLVLMLLDRGPFSIPMRLRVSRNHCDQTISLLRLRYWIPHLVRNKLFHVEVIRPYSDEGVKEL